MDKIAVIAIVGLALICLFARTFKYVRSAAKGGGCGSGCGCGKKSAAGNEKS